MRQRWSRKLGAATVYVRGRRLWARWPDGKGGQVRVPLADEDGSTLLADSKRQQVSASATRQYQEWLRSRQAEQSVEFSAWTLNRLLEVFNTSKFDGWDEKTVKLYSSYAREMLLYFGRDRELSTITSLDALQFQQWLHTEKKVATGAAKKQGLSTDSVNHRMAYARQVFQWALDFEVCSRNVFRRVKPLKNQPVRNLLPFTVEEVRRLLEAAERVRPWLYPCLAFVALTGARRNSVRMLDVRDFEATTGMLTIRDEIAKQKRGHRYALPDCFRPVLEELVHGRKPNDPLFRSPYGRRLADKVFVVNPYQKQNYTSPWRRVLDAAGVAPRGIHCLRASVVTNLVEADCSLDLATEITGQTVEVARRHYLRTRLDSQRRTMSLLAKTIGLETDSGIAESTAGQGDVDDGCVSQESAEVSVKMSKVEADHVLRGLKLVMNFVGETCTETMHNFASSFLNHLESIAGKGLAERGRFELPV